MTGHTLTIIGFEDEMVVAACSCGWTTSRRSRVGVDVAFNEHLNAQTNLITEAPYFPKTEEDSR